jgi:ribosome biogenesis GTPase
MHRLDHGGWLLDTPGMRELQLSDAASGLAEVFDDIEAAATRCRFANCRHKAEPGCTVQAALDEGMFSVGRLERWRRLTAEDQLNSANLERRRGGERSRHGLSGALKPQYRSRSR